jgi:flagellar hook-basal body complex protein FliE
MDPKEAHQAAAVAMQYVFSVDITAMQAYQDIMRVWR